MSKNVIVEFDEDGKRVDTPKQIIVLKSDWDTLQKENAELKEDRDYYKKIAKTRDEWNTVLAKKDTQKAKVIEQAKDLLVDAFQYLTPFTKIYEEIEDFLAEQGGEG